MNCPYTISHIHFIPSSSEDGFFAALSKFAGCLGAATVAWIAATLAVIPLIVVIRSKVRIPPIDGPRIHGAFSVLGSDGEAEDGADTSIYNGTAQPDRPPITRYSRLVDPSEMKALSSSNRASSKV